MLLKLLQVISNHINRNSLILLFNWCYPNFLSNIYLSDHTTLYGHNVCHILISTAHTLCTYCFLVVHQSTLCSTTGSPQCCITFPLTWLGFHPALSCAYILARGERKVFVVSKGLGSARLWSTIHISVKVKQVIKVSALYLLSSNNRHHYTFVLNLLTGDALNHCRFVAPCKCYCFFFLDTSTSMYCVPESFLLICENFLKLVDRMIWSMNYWTLPFINKLISISYRLGLWWK